MSDCFPELVAEVAPVRHDFVADGELVVLDEQGRPVWERLHGRHRLKDRRRIRYAAEADPAAIFAFDLLWLDGADFRQRPLLQRKAALHGTLPANRRVRYAGHIAGSCVDLWRLANELELEGIVAKDSEVDLRRRAQHALAEGQNSRRRRARAAAQTVSAGVTELLSASSTPIPRCSRMAHARCGVVRPTI